MLLNIIILAAGKGKRLNSDINKVLHKIGGISMIKRVVEVAAALEPSKIFVVTKSNNDEIKEELLDFKLIFVEQSEQLGTGHAVSKVLPSLDENERTLILYGDVPLVTTELLQRLIKATGENEVGLIVAKIDNPTGFGRILRDQNNKIVGIVEEKDATEDQLKIKEINSGIFLVPNYALKTYIPQIKNINEQKEYYLTDLIAMFSKGNLQINSVEASCINQILGVNDRAQLAMLERVYQKNIAEELMSKGVTLLDPNRFDLRGEITTGKDVTIDINAIFCGKVKIGNNVKIDSNVTISNTIIGNNVHIKANTFIEDAIIKDCCVVGPFARIRLGTTLLKNSKVGNFVEIKNTELGSGSKANHLTHLGDASVGSNVNIGAGTITCNYDGANKHKTIIKNDAFIGSGCQLVAPVVIGEGSTIGAGSTITQNAPDGKLVIARVKQCTIEGWKPKEKEV